MLCFFTINVMNNTARNFVINFQISLDNGLAKIRCNVLCWNDIAMSFYNKIGGMVEDEWRQCTFTREVMKQLANPQS